MLMLAELSTGGGDIIQSDKPPGGDGDGTSEHHKTFLVTPSVFLSATSEMKEGVNDTFSTEKRIIASTFAHL